MGSIDELKRIIINEPEKLIVGSERTLKYLRLGKIKKVFVANNAPEALLEDIEYYAKLSDTEVSKLSINNEELGAVLGKPYNVAVVSLIK